ncbi:Vegetative incompatibility protein HET-E-1 [Colletotrichum siamense]|uniref:Vegetative incompatibility protein HET-E-1 n=1 Tax=Colletotrichum siamense TaxID=690259 RepID=UPI0018722271|nr:Vegetative incompatibility protein HET-E-1 [Colletotrichum siamense]KAF5515376.1 Vegetative incompatibility protein HET-E-1 [Colletotrichum siamense]
MSIRLIEVETLRLKSFNSSKPPPYAILSHTWVEDEEQIAENPSHPATRTSGYYKIQKTCCQAWEHGLEYAWVDTCCIDKSSSAELSEAINSMFRWYRNAAVCFAYLSDYRFLDSSHLRKMRECKWFTRGWCLQELIAPKHLIFYDRAWRAFGSRHDLQDLVASITLIDKGVLEDHTIMYSLPVARKMSWASSRITTRVEDIAYCLLGIFDIHMPMLYGEGERAFLRLQEEIIRQFNDMSIFLFSPKASEMTSMSSPEISQTYEQSSTNYDSADSTSAEYLGDLMSFQFCGMFATSPVDFGTCRDVVHRPGSRAPFDRQAFAVTNRGIQLGRQELHCIQGKNCFIWETSFCHSNSTDSMVTGAIFLRKIGRNLFARVLLLPLTPADVGSHTLHNDACVLLYMTPSIHRQICNALEAVLRIQVKGCFAHRALLSEPTPMDNWDESGKLFLIQDYHSVVRPFMGSIRISPVSRRGKKLLSEGEKVLRTSFCRS